MARVSFSCSTSSFLIDPLSVDPINLSLSHLSAKDEAWDDIGDGVLILTIANHTMIFF